MGYVLSVGILTASNSVVLKIVGGSVGLMLYRYIKAPRKIAQILLYKNFPVYIGFLIASFPRHLGFIDSLMFLRNS